MQYSTNNKTYVSQSFPSLRGNVNKVDKGELKNIKINNKIDNGLSTPPPLWDTSLQSRDELITNNGD